MLINFLSLNRQCFCSPPYWPK